MIEIQRTVTIECDEIDERFVESFAKTVQSLVQRQQVAEGELVCGEVKLMGRIKRIWIAVGARNNFSTWKYLYGPVKFKVTVDETIVQNVPVES
jgi:hypothetical protein